MKCFNCGMDIVDAEANSCANCLAIINATKTNFISYIGSPDSLAGYQKSYKLVLLKYIILEYLDTGTASVSDVINNVRSFYLNRKANGLKPDYNVDSRIENIEKSSDYDVFAVMKSQPYKVINEKGYLYLNRNSENKLIFSFNDIIMASMIKEEWRKLLNIIDQKLELYYSHYDEKTLLNNHHCADEIKNEEEYQCEPTCESIGSVDSNNNVSVLDIPVLSNRAKNVLMRNGIFVLGDLYAYIQSNELSSLKNMGQITKDEIESFLNSLNNASYVHEKTDSIESLFCERKYKMFVNYCKNNNINVLSELDNFDFSNLLNEPGFGINKVNSIISKYNSLEKKKRNFVSKSTSPNLLSEPATEIHTTNKHLDISFLRYAGVTQKDISKLAERGYLNFEMMVDFTKTKSIQIFGQNRGTNNFEKVQIFKTPLTQIAFDYLKSYRENKDFEFFIHRANKKTLQAIAEQYNLTRERVRQIETRFFNQLLPLFEKIVETYMSDNSVSHITLQEVLDFFDDDDFDTVIIHTLKNSPKYEYLDFAEIFVKKENTDRTVAETLYSLTEDLIGEGFYFFDSLPEIESMLNNSGLDYISTDSYLNYLIEIDAYFYGDFVSLKKLSYSKLCLMLINKYFKDGINLNSDEDMVLLRKYFSQEFGNYKLPEQNRAIAARLADHMIICDRGKAKTIENIHYEQDVIEEIKTYIDNSELNSLFFSEVFNEFEGILAFTSDITNSYALHGILSYLYRDEYEFSRDCITKKNYDGPVLTLSDRIINIIHKAGRAVSRAEIKQKIGGLSDIMLFNAVNSSQQLLQWDYNKFNILSNINISNEDESKLEELLLNIFSSNKGYCSDRLIYEKAKIELQDFIKKSHIENSTNLFYVLQSLYSSKYHFSRPHICKEKFVNSITTKGIALYLLDAKEYMNRQDFANMAKKVLWSITTADMIFSELEKEYTRISEDDYIINSNFEIDTDNLIALRKTLDSEFEEKCYISMIGYDDFEKFPSIQYEWNTFLLISLIKRYDLGYKTVSPVINDRRYNKEIIVPSNSEWNDLCDIVISLMKENNIVVIDEADLLSFLIIHHLVAKIIPKELYDSEKINYADGYFRFE